jgi:hypothetical protein
MTILIPLGIISYMVTGIVYYTCTCEDEIAVGNPLKWLYQMSGWIILMWF